MAIWSLVEALDFWNVAKVQLGSHGFLCGIYGSVLEGQGRDLDLLIIPKRINTSIQFAAEDLATAHRAKLSEAYEGIMGTRAYLLTLSSGHIVDLQFYKPRGPRDAEELYLSLGADSTPAKGTTR